MRRVEEHAAVQAIARSVLTALASTIVHSDTERTIAARADSLLADRGVAETWYYDCPALVLLGSRSCLSVSGRDYLPADEPVGEFNVVTVDLSPLRDGIWGDCARTFPIEHGRYAVAPLMEDIRQGLATEERLHRAVQEFAAPDMTFEELFEFGNAEIRRLGFENLDYLGNLGHSIVARLEDRQYLEAGNTLPLGAVPCFTSEPHIRQIGGVWGFKHEEIYCFDNERRLRVL